MIPWYAYVMVALVAISSAITILNVNRPRDGTIKPGVALGILVTNGLFIWGILALASNGGA